jgi:hypothetical protein
LLKKLKGKACGVDAGYEDYKYIYFAVPFFDNLNKTTCLKKCPTWNTTTPKPTELECKTNSIIQDCKVTNNLDPLDPVSIVKGKSSAMNLYNSTGSKNNFFYILFEKILFLL